MKKIFYFLAFLFVSCISYAQTLTNTENYVYSRTYLEAVTTENPAAKQVEAVQYYDGLGRNKQTIAIKSTVNGKDLVVANAYDLQGRQTKSYLPVPANSLSGAYQTTIDSTSANTYYQISNAYEEVLLEKSPLGRVLKQAHPGADWAINTSNTVKYDYQANTANTANEEIKRLKAITTWNTTTKINDITIDFAPNDSYTTNGFYNANTLAKKIVKDEDDKETQIFTNSFGQTILLRKVNKTDSGTTQYLDTYYVYDDFGNLVMVIPPKAATFNTIIDLNNIKDKLCYQYRYDKYNRVVEKKLPGKKYWEYVIYDKQGRPILSQDSNQHNKTWSFVKYDQFDRIVYTGIYTLANTSRDILQWIVDGSSNTLNNEARSNTSFTINNQYVYYTNTAFPTSSITVNQIHYYDDYSINTASGVISKPATILGVTSLNDTPTSVTSNGITTSRSTKSLPTISLIRNTDADNWSSAYIWYDRQARVIGTHSVNYRGGYTKTERLLDFSGTTQELYTYHKLLSTSTEIKIKDWFTYTTKNVLLKHYQQILNNGSGGIVPQELLADYTYNDLGQVTNKKVGSNLQSIDYTYNIRGWLTSINDINNLGTDVFAYKIKYNEMQGLANPNATFINQTVKKNYNGNITEVDYKTAGALSDGKMRRYGFVYDNVNRLRAGLYQDQTNPSSQEYSEYLEYDLNGNITKLNRTGKIQTNFPEVMDDLTYNYAANDNVLTSLTESSKGNALSGYKLAPNTTSSVAFGYDDNGNNTTNYDIGITNIAYNFLNLPTAITTNNGKDVSYIYRADGVKVKKVANGKTTEYIDGFQYEGGSIQFYPNEEGYYDFKNAKYIYNYRDHLGNVRVTYTKNASNVAVVLEENHYYPFGLKHQGYSTGNTANPNYAYKYNGKELQENGLLDYGWRNYLPELGRWNVIDQLAEKYHSYSPYAYAINMPIAFTDPDGRDPVETKDGWTFSGGDINLLMSYLQSGGNVKALVSALESWSATSGGSGGGGGGGGNQFSFWTSFNTGGVINNVNFNNGYLFWWSGGGKIPGGMDVGTWHREFVNTSNKYTIGENPNTKYGWDYAADRLWNTAKLAANSTDFAYSGLAGISHSKYGWLDAKGKYHKVSELAKQANGKYLRGVQGKRISAATAKAFSANMGKIAKKAGFAGYVLDGAEAVYDGKITAGEVSKMTINVVSAYAGPVGWIWMGADIGVAFFNDGKGLNDMIAEEIDNSLGNNATLIKF